MAIVQSLAVGKARKSAGNITFSTVKGQVIIKSKPINVRNPRTPLQLSQRSAMTKVIYIWQVLGSYVKDGITRTSRFGSQYNRFVSLNINKVNDIWLDEQEAGDVIFNGIQVADGVLPELETNFTQANDELNVFVTMSDTVKNAVKAGDLIKVVAFDQNYQTAKVVTHEITPANLNADKVSLFAVYDDMQKRREVVYTAYLLSADGKKSSPAITRTV